MQAEIIAINIATAIITDPATTTTLVDNTSTTVPSQSIAIATIPN